MAIEYTGTETLITVNDATSTIDVTSSVNTITVSDSTNSSWIRSLFGATLPVTYDNVTGIYGLDDPSLYAKFSGELPISYDAVTGTFSIDDPSLYAKFSGTAPILYDAVTGTFSIDDPSLYAKFSGTAPILYDAVTGTFSIDDAALFSGKTTDDLAEGVTNLYYTNQRVYDYIIAEGLDFNAEKVDDRVAELTVAGNGITVTYDDVANTLTHAVNMTVFTTDDLAEGVTNKYYTDQRVYDYIIANGLDFNAEKVDDQVAILMQDGTGITFTYNDTLNTLTPTVSLTAFDTDALAEGVTNKYYSESLFSASLSTKTTDDLAEGITNLYFTDARVDTRVGALSTDNLAEGITNLYFTDARVDARVANFAGDIVTTGSITAAEFYGNGTSLVIDTLVDQVVVIGDVTVDKYIGSVHQLGIYGDITSISFLNLAIGESITLVIQQDTFGSHVLDINHANWTDTWTFVEDHSQLNDNPNAIDILTVLKTGATTYLAAISHTENVSSVDALTDVVITTAANGEVLTFNGTNWVNAAPSGAVDSVNSQTGVVVLDTDDIAEGTNLYHTDARARAAISVSGDLSYNSTTGVISYTDSATPTSVNDLTDVVITTPAATEVLTFDGANWVNSPVPTDNVVSVNSLTGTVVLDTDDIAEGTNLYHTDARARAAISVSGDLSYDNVTGIISYTDSATPTSVNDLTDVVVTTPATNEVLTYDGANWVNAAPTGGGAAAIDDLTDVVITTPALNETLSYDGANWINIAASGGMTQQQFNDWFDTRFSQTIVLDGGYSGPHDGGTSTTVYDANDYYINGGTA